MTQEKFETLVNELGNNNGIVVAENGMPLLANCLEFDNDKGVVLVTWINEPALKAWGINLHFINNK